MRNLAFNNPWICPNNLQLAVFLWQFCIATSISYSASDLDLRNNLSLPGRCRIRTIHWHPLSLAKPRASLAQSSPQSIPNPLYDTVTSLSGARDHSLTEKKSVIPQPWLYSCLVLSCLKLSLPLCCALSFASPDFLNIQQQILLDELVPIEIDECDNITTRLFFSAC